MNDATDAEENDPKHEVDDEILAGALFEENDYGWEEDGEDDV